MIAALLFLITNLFQLVPISFEVTSAFKKLQGDKYIYMPRWVSIFYGVAYFLAMLPTAIYPYIFCGSDLLLPFCKNNTPEEELLIEDDIVEEDGFESTQI
eukprot:TRINITY_DN20675_c0_g1_i1.p1 TRINITY_DN20675_c0_g1~~TRINITY_DN20675_c0_g1_i1.p1  ORF type:complete len:100 (-),score=18.64 TRINITY_DN20675_c0_g1_i1:62-361(-)